MVRSWLRTTPAQRSSTRAGSGVNELVRSTFPLVLVQSVPVKPFVVNVADLMHRPGVRRTEHLVGTTAAMTVAATDVVDQAALEVESKLEPAGLGILATGWAQVDWRSLCRRCEQPVVGTTRAEFQEQFEPGADPDGDTFPMSRDQVDLELVAREAILLDLPLAPVCREECAGLCPTCGADLNDGACTCVPVAADPRWAALDVLFTPGTQHTEEG